MAAAAKNLSVRQEERQRRTGPASQDRAVELSNANLLPFDKHTDYILGKTVYGLESVSQGWLEYLLSDPEHMLQRVLQLTTTGFLGSALNTSNHKTKIMILHSFDDADSKNSPRNC